MSVENPNPQPEELATSRFAKLRQMGALALGAVILAVGVHEWDVHSINDKANQILGTTGSLYGVQPEDMTGQGLPTIPPLSGAANTVTKAQRNELERATVAVLAGAVGDRRWGGDGTGTKISYRGHNYVLAALHLLNFSYKFPLEPRAADGLTGDKTHYAITDPRLSKSRQYIGKILGRVSGASFFEPANEMAPDVTMLRINPTPQYSATLTYKKVSAIPMADHFKPLPKPGQQVFIYGATNNNISHPVGGDGTYLGRARVPGVNTSIESVDIVGLKVVDSSRDACEHTHSGESFIASTNYVSGPLYYRAPLPSENVPFGEHIGQDQLTSARWQIQKALHANLSEYTVLCGFTVIPPQLPAKLLKGFGVQLDPNR